MIVVSDTSPLNYLILIDAVGVLPKLYGRVLIPEAVANELMHPHTPAKVRHWVLRMPDWLEVKKAPRDLPGLERWQLDRGEREAIALAAAWHVHLILIDEAMGRQAAAEAELQAIGTIGILRDASKAGLLDLRQTIARLRETRFHISERILKDVLDETKGS